MLKIALTGSTLSGKNTVLKEFEMFGIPIFDADIATKFLIHYNTNIINSINKKFGERAYKVGFLDKKFFDTDDKVDNLLSIVQNDLLYFYSEFIRRNNNPFAHFSIFKCSYYFERNLDNFKQNRIISISDDNNSVNSDEFFFDGSINVYTPSDIREFRSYARSKTSFSSMNEIPGENKKKAATFNIDSYTGSKNVKDQVREIVSKLNSKYTPKPIPFQL